MKRIFTSVALFLCTLCTFAQFSGSGSGTSSDPYQITTAYQLSQMRNFLNQADVYFKLMNDIDLTDFIAEEYLSQGWLPIGVASSPFKGTFDGNGKTITGLMINRTSTSYIGLFGRMTDGTIKNLTIQDCDVKGSSYVGALVGYATFSSSSTSTNISNCSISGDVVGSADNVGGFCGYASFTNISNSYFTGNVKGNKNVGGLSGENLGNTSQCHVSGTIEGTSLYVGGLCGHQGSGKTISLCSVKANINGKTTVGGLFGYIESSSSSVSECFVSGTITATGNTVGGLIGNCYSSNIYNNFYEGIISGSSQVGGIVGYNRGGNFSYCYANATIEGSASVGGICGYHQAGKLISNAAINSKVSMNSTNTTIGRIYGDKDNGTTGAMGTSQENKSLNTTSIYINKKLQTDITDGPQHGTGTSMSSLKRQDTYVALGWDFDDVWGIDEGTSFPYLLNNPNTPTQSLTVTIPSTMKYGDTPISLPATTDQGKALTWTSSNNSVLSVANGVLTPVKVGSATITATETGSSSGNAFSQTFDVTVQKAPLVITAKSYTITQGDALPTFEAIYSGFKNGETASVLTTLPTFDYPTTPPDAPSTYTIADIPGTYTITPSGAVATNYAISYVSGTLTVEPSTGDIDINIVIPSSGMTTYSSAYDLDFSEVKAFKAYVFVGYSKKTNTVYALQVDEAPAGTGLFLKGKAGTYEMSVTESESYHLDMLVGVINATTIQATEGRFTNLIPYTIGGSTVFIPANNGSSVDANRAYLQIETARYYGQPAEIFFIDKNTLLGDINKDGEVTSTDVTLLVKMITGK